MLFCSVFFTTFAQENPSPVDNNAIANMSMDQLQAYQKVLKIQQETQRTIPSPSKLQEYANVGKALGQAFKECWSTVSTDAEKFAQSDAGKWTAFLITWKVMGKDTLDLVKTTVRWFIGMCIISVITPFFMFLVWKNCVPKRILISKERTSFWNVKKVYSDENSSPEHSDWIAAYAFVYLVFMILTSILMFG